MDSNEPISGGLLAEPRSIMQTLTGKFQPGPDVAAIQSINEAFAKIQIARAQKLAASRDVLHRNPFSHFINFIITIPFTIMVIVYRMDEKSRRCQMGSPTTSRS